MLLHFRVKMVSRRRRSRVSLAFQRGDLRQAAAAQRGSRFRRPRRSL